jgi:glycosyltransferase involved in cell wall biosynthesis
VKVSVVLTTYNRAAVLSRTIEEILAQTLGDFELIVSDDNSTDATPEVAQAYARRDARVRYRRNARNLGMPGNLNAGLAEAGGAYVANLHDGDFHAKDLLEKWAGRLDDCDRAAFVFNAYGEVDAAGRPVTIYREPLAPCQRGGEFLRRIMFRRWRFGCPVRGTVMARRRVYEELGFFQPRFGFCSDVDMWMRMAATHHVAYVDEPLITVPTAKALPRQVLVDAYATQRLLERMFLEGRRRCFAGRPVRMALELGRHVTHVAAARAYIAAIHMRQSLRVRPA